MLWIFWLGASNASTIQPTNRHFCNRVIFLNVCFPCLIQMCMTKLCDGLSMVLPYSAVLDHFTHMQTFFNFFLFFINLIQHNQFDIFICMWCMVTFWFRIRIIVLKIENTSWQTEIELSLAAVHRLIYGNLYKIARRRIE